MQGNNFFLDENKIPPNIQHDHLAHLFEFEQARKKAETEQTRQALQAWQRKYRAHRVELLGGENSARLSEYVARNRKSEPDESGKPMFVSPTQRFEKRRRNRLNSLRYMQDLAVNRAGLLQLYEAAQREFQEIVRPVSSLPSLADIRILDQGFSYRPLEFTKPLKMQSLPSLLPSARGTIAAPPYAGWWNRGWYAYQSGDGQSLRLDSYLWAEAAESGSCVWSKNWDASDFDYLMAGYENGFLVPYTVPTNGIIKVEFDVQCAFTEHCIETNDEWGWSDYSAWTNERAVMSVFWNWEDIVPGTESRDVYFVWGLDSSGDGESYPGLVYPVPAGQRRTLTMYTNMAFPAGVMVWVYVGTEQRLSAVVNDVGINIFVNAGWYVTGIRVGQG